MAAFDGTSAACGMLLAHRNDVTASATRRQESGDQRDCSTVRNPNSQNGKIRKASVRSRSEIKEMEERTQQRLKSRNESFQKGCEESIL